MKNPEVSENMTINDIRILIFSVMNVKFGVDMEMIAEMCEPDQARDRKIRRVHIHEKLSFNMNVVEYAFPKVLILKDRNGRTGIVIDQPEAINVTVKIDDILPRPSLIELVDPASPIWGFVLMKPDVVMLLDPLKLLALNPGEERRGV